VSAEKNVKCASLNTGDLCDGGVGDAIARREVQQMQVAQLTDWPHLGLVNTMLGPGCGQFACRRMEDVESLVAACAATPSHRSITALRQFLTVVII